MARNGHPAPTFVDRAETMLLGFASGALTGAACLAVAKRQFVRRAGGQQRKANVEPSDAGSVQPPALSSDERPAGPLKHANDFLQQIRSARAAATASVAEFKHLVGQQRLGLGDNLLQHLQVLEDELVSAGSLLPSCPPSPAQAPEEQQQQESEPSCTPHDEAHQQQQKPGEDHPAALDQHPDTHSLQQELAAAQAEAADAKQQLHQVHAQLTAAQEELQALQAGRAELQSDMGDVQDCVNDLTQQLQAAQLRYVRSQQHLSQLQLIVDDLLQQLQTTQQQSQQTDRQLQQTEVQLTEASNQLQQAAADFTQLKKQLAEEQSQAQQKAQVLAGTVAGVTEAHQQLQQYVGLKQQLQAALANLEAQVKDSSDQVDAHMIQLNTFKKQQQMSLQQQQQQHQNWGIQQAEVQLDAVQQQQHLQLRLDTAKASLQEAALMGQALECDLGVLEQLLQGMHAASAAASEMQLLVQEAQSMTQGCRKELAAAQMELDAEKHAAKAQSQVHQQQLQHLQAQLAAAEQEIESGRLTADSQLDLLQAVEAELAEAWQQLKQQQEEEKEHKQDGDHEQEQAQQQKQHQTVEQAVESAASEVAHAAPNVEEQASQLLSRGDGGCAGQPTVTGPIEPGASSNTASVSVPSVGVACGSDPTSALRGVGQPAVLLTEALLPALSNSAARLLFDNPTKLPAQCSSAAVAPTSSLLAELQHESDELAEQLTQLQQYLKTSSAKYNDMHSIEALDEGLQKLRHVTDSVVLVAASTVERVSGGGGVLSAPGSFAGRAPLHAGVIVKQRQKQTSLTGTACMPKSPVSVAGAAPRSVAMRRLGLELPRLDSWGSEATPVEPVQPALCCVASEGSLQAGEAVSPTTTQDCARATASATAPADALHSGPAAALCLDNWGSELSEAACTWLAGDLQVEEELSSSFPGTPVDSFTASPAPSVAGAAAAAAAVRVPSRLAAVSIAAAHSEPGLLAAWGSGMLPFSGAGSAVQEQQQATPKEPRQVHLSQTSSSPTTLQQQLQLALAEVQQLADERSLLQTQVLQLADLAQHQEDRLAINTQLLEALTTGLLSEGLMTSDALHPASTGDESGERSEELQQ